MQTSTVSVVGTRNLFFII